MAKLAIVGAGFVGASLALALRRSRLFDTISGWDRDRARLETARRVGALDDVGRGPAAAVESAAVVVVTVPSTELETSFREIAPGLSDGAVVTDTSTWKVPAQRAAAVLPQAVHYIGGRPVLDRAAHGPDEASAAALRDAIYCLTPSTGASDAAIEVMTALVTAAGAQPYFLEAGEHDALTAASELLPGALLAALPLALTRDPAWTDAGKLAGDSFNRLARLAEELDGAYWQQAADNAAVLGRWLDAAATTLLELRERLQPDTVDGLAADWTAARQAIVHWRRDRRQLLERGSVSGADPRPNLLGSLGRLRR